MTNDLFGIAASGWIRTLWTLVAHHPEVVCLLSPLTSVCHTMKPHPLPLYSHNMTWMIWYNDWQKRVENKDNVTLNWLCFVKAQSAAYMQMMPVEEWPSCRPVNSHALGMLRETYALVVRLMHLWSVSHSHVYGWNLTITSVMFCPV